MTEDLRNEIVITYLKQLRLNRIARDCESLAREAEQRGLGYVGYLQALLEADPDALTIRGSCVPGDGNVFVVLAGWKRHVPSPATFDALGITGDDLIPIPDGWLTTAKPLLDVAATGRLIRPPGEQVPIYVMDGGAKRHVVSPAAMAACGYGWDAVSILPASTVGAFSNGPVLNGTPCPQPTFSDGTLLLGSDGRVWASQAGQRRWITDSTTFAACGYRGIDIDRIADSIIGALPLGPNLTGKPCP